MIVSKLSSSFQETSYLKKQVTNEREKQLKWKDLYFEARSELTDLKEQLIQYQQQQQQSSNNNNNNSTTSSSSGIAVASSSGAITTVANNNNDIISDHNNNNPTTTTMVLHPPHMRRVPHPSHVSFIHFIFSRFSGWYRTILVFPSIQIRVRSFMSSTYQGTLGN